MSCTPTFSPFELSPLSTDRGTRAESSSFRGLAFSRRRQALLTVKRVLDVVGSAVGLVFLSPVLLVIAALIRWQSPGPVIFWQQRVGKDGQVFWFLKFRTMVVNAEDQLKQLETSNESTCGVLFKIRDDPRVTRLGRFLRKSSLDELPQLFNVLLGDMTLVGPRPLQVRDSDRLQFSSPEGFSLRASVTPGLTGPWQVGGRSEADSGTMLRLDLDYIQNMSLARDLFILCRTFVVVLHGRGAY